MTYIITHHDADGIISAALITYYKNIEKPRIFFTSPFNLIRLLSFIINKNIELRNNNFEDMFILDLSPTKQTTALASLFNTTWIDHHECQIKKEINEMTKLFNIKFFIKKEKSNVQVIYDILKKENKSKDTKKIERIVDIANQIDTNDIKDKGAESFRDLIACIRHNYRGAVLSKEMYSITKKITENIKQDLDPFTNIYEGKEGIINEYLNWLKQKEKIIIKKLKTQEINKIKIAYIELEEHIPVYYITNLLKNKGPFDIILVMTKNMVSTKLEFRTQTGFNVYNIAKLFNGGGHKVASGATATIPTSLVLFKIKKYLEKLNEK